MMSWVRDTPLAVGFNPPEQRVRGRTDCRSLAQIISTPDGITAEPGCTFMCVGERDPERMTGDASDQWRFCHRSKQGRDYVGHVDISIDVNRYDLAHMAGVISMGLAMAQPYDDPRPCASESYAATLPDGDGRGG